MRISPRRLLVLCLITLAAAACITRAGIPGGGSTSTEYVGRTTAAGRRLELSVSLDRVLFPLLTMRDKYRVARIIVRNGAASIPLSVEKDGVAMTLAGEAGEGSREVKGIVNIGAEDPEFWGALTQNERNQLAYPDLLAAAPGGVNAAPVVTVLFVFFPAKDVTRLPENFTLRLDALTDPIDIRPKPLAAD